MIASSPDTEDRPSPSSTRRVRRFPAFYTTRERDPDDHTAKTTKKVVLRLECTVCKTKAQLSLKRCKHFELGYVLITSLSLLRAAADSLTVETRRPRVLLLSFRCSSNLGEKLLGRFVNSSFPSADQRYGDKTNLSLGVVVASILGKETGAMRFGMEFFCDVFRVIFLYRDITFSTGQLYHTKRTSELKTALIWA